MKIKLSNVLFNILAIITVVAVAFVMFNIFSSSKGYSVITDSMSPEINRGDVVFVKQVDFNSLKKGDIVTVTFPDGSGVFTHRIIEIDYESQVIRTKGDTNESRDPQPSMKEQINGKVWYSVPLLGYFSIALNNLGAIKLSVILAVTAIALIAVSTVALKIKKAKTRGDKE